MLRIWAVSPSISGIWGKFSEVSSEKFPDFQNLRFWKFPRFFWSVFYRFWLDPGGFFRQAENPKIWLSSKVRFLKSADFLTKISRFLSSTDTVEVFRRFSAEKLRNFLSSGQGFLFLILRFFAKIAESPQIFLRKILPEISAKKAKISDLHVPIFLIFYFAQARFRLGEIFRDRTDTKQIVL